MPRACLPKHAKLLKAADYNYVFDKPVRSSDRYFTVLARPNNMLQSRLGTAFSKKRVKLAVTRNRLKRITRESFRLSRPGQEKLKLDYVVLAGPYCTKATNQQLFHSLETHWQQLIKKCEKL
jgi:ribonuclease P protein component